ncbi:MAG: transcriptional regulator [Dehalococcoidales bacterium]|nr:transcriptional regulator [Dehalococcoidales bacterium]
MRLDRVDQRLLGLLQTRVLLTSKPYAELGQSLGVAEDEVIRRIEQMKLKGLVRQISPVLDARRLGYKTTLIAMRVEETHLDRAARFLTEHSGVSHAYEREHQFNLWFTLAVPDTVDTDSELLQLADMIESETAFDLPTVKVFKIRTYFSLDEDDHPAVPVGTPNGVTRQDVYLSTIDREVINELQQDLSLISRPFTEMSARLRIDEEKFLTQCQSLLSRGIIRRFGASVNHRRVGFAANAMTCWAVPAEKAEVIAEKLVPLKQVSHCYERKTNPEWHYNLFAMIHGHTREQCQGIADKVSIETGFTDYVLLFSTREFKKTRVIYRV